MHKIDLPQIKSHASAILRLAGPLIVNNLAVAGMQFADTVMSGRIGAQELAAVAVGGSFWFLGFSLCMGLLMSISPIVARHFGAGRLNLIGRYTRQGLYLAVLLGLPIIAAGRYLASPILTWIGIDPDFRELTVGYVAAITLGAPGILAFLALRFTTEGVGLTRPIMYTSVFSLICNVFLNYVLMFGHFGAPALGAIGCGYASAITMWIICFSLGTYMYFSERYKSFHLFSKLSPVRLSAFKEIFALGTPIAVSITAEAGLFSAIALLMGTRGTEIMAGHQIAISFASTMFMVPLALSAAITVRVGQLLGSGDLLEARRSGVVGIGMCAGIMAIAAVLMLAFRHSVVVFYNEDPAVIEVALGLMLMAAIFQVADGVQIGAAGALRGFKDTAVPMGINLFAYWVLAFPLAYLAAIKYQAPPNYVWAGFIVGLTVSAVLLSWRFNAVSKVRLPTLA